MHGRTDERHVQVLKRRPHADGGIGTHVCLPAVVRLIEGHKIQWLRSRVPGGVISLHMTEGFPIRSPDHRLENHLRGQRSPGVVIVVVSPVQPELRALALIARAAFLRIMRLVNETPVLSRVGGHGRHRYTCGRPVVSLHRESAGGAHDPKIAAADIHEIPLLGRDPDIGG